MLSIVLPAYKEEENLKNIIPKIKETLNVESIEHEILVVDTMTPVDCTEQVCVENAVKYVRRSGGNNYGDAIRTGITEASGEFLLIMDADGSHDPRYIKQFIDKQREKDADLIIGSRYVNGGDSDNSFVLKLMSKVLNMTYRYVFNIKAKDVSDSFRLYKSNQIKCLKLECNNFDIVEEIIIQLVVKNTEFKIIELPIYFNKRMFGESKRNLVIFIFSYIQTMARLYGIKKRIQREI